MKYKLILAGILVISPVVNALDSWGLITPIESYIAGENNYRAHNPRSSKQKEKDRLAGMKDDKMLLARAKVHAKTLVAQGGKMTHVKDPHKTMIIMMPKSIMGPCRIYGAKHLIVASEIDHIVAVTQFYKMMVTNRMHFAADRGEIIPFEAYARADKETGNDLGMAQYIAACIDEGQAPKVSLTFWQARLNSLVGYINRQHLLK